MSYFLILYQIEVCINTTQTDIVFVIDASGSVGSSNFQSMLQWMTSVVGALDIGDDGFR